LDVVASVAFMVLVVWQQTHSFGKPLLYPLGSWLTVFLEWDRNSIGGE
jgi:hypothetical protein